MGDDSEMAALDRVIFMSTSPPSALSELIDQLVDCFTPDVAQRVAALRASPEVQAKLDDLADRCNEGTLSAEERERYEYYVRGINLITLLQAKCRSMLKSG